MKDVVSICGTQDKTRAVPGPPYCDQSHRDFKGHMKKKKMFDNEAHIMKK